MSLKNVLAIALGILSAIGGFVDIGDLVFNTQAGATFGYQLLWVVVVGVVGIIVYSEMCGRVAAVAKRPVFDLVRERAGFGAGLGTLIASAVVNLLTCAAEIGGVAICLQLLSGLPYRLLIALAVVGPGRGLLGAAVRVDRARLRLPGPLPARLRRRRDQAAPGLGDGRPRVRPRPSHRRQPVGLPVLRRRPARRRDDAVRGLLLLVRGGRGRLGPEGARPEQGDRDDRLRARRLPLVLADDRRGRPVPAAEHRPAVPRHAARWRPRMRSGRSASCSPSSGSSSRSAARRSRPRSRARTTRPSSSAGAGARRSALQRRRASRWRGS